MDLMIYMLDLFGTAVFAVSGALAAGRKRMDIFGLIVLGCVTALGGGTLRDVMLDLPGTQLAIGARHALFKPSAGFRRFAVHLVLNHCRPVPSSVDGKTYPRGDSATLPQPS